MKRTCLFILLGLTILGLGTVVTAAPAVDTVENYIIGAGGVTVGAGEYELSFTLGQPVIGEMEVGTNALCSGYWCDPLYPIFLPMIVRNP